MVDESARARLGTVIPPGVLAAGLVVSFALLLPSLAVGFLYDDARMILINRGPPAHLLASFVELRDSFYRPVFSVVIGLEGDLFGDLAAPYHAVNLVLHGACGWLVYRIGRRAGGAGAGAIAALLFVGGGTHVEAVEWITGLHSLLTAFGPLVALELLGRRERWSDLAAVAAWLFGLLGKENAFTFPLAVVGLWLVAGPAQLRKRTWFVVPALVLMVAYAPLRAAAGSGYDVAPTPLLLVKNAAYYAVTLVLPLPDDYRYASDLAAWREAPWLGALCLVLSLPLFACIAVARERLAWRPALAWLVWAALTSLVALPILAERQAYLPSAGVAIAIGVLVAPELRTARAHAVLLVLGLFLLGQWIALGERTYWWTRASALSDGATAVALEATKGDPPGTRLAVYNVPDHLRMAHVQGLHFGWTLQLRSGGTIQAGEVFVPVDPNGARLTPEQAFADAGARASGAPLHAVVLDDERIAAERRFP